HQPTALDNEGGVVATYGRDVAAGALGASAMVLPGISGAYMLLILGRYEAVLMAIDLARDHATSGGTQGDAAEYLRILIPVAVGAVLAIVLLSNGLKWLLRRHEQGTCSVLLGILVGSVIGIWPFDRACRPGDYALGAALAAAGFTATLLLGRIGGASRGITPPV
ncbi:MAG: undecaprenyl phosphate translocase family protein, partial [Phycisphaerae bacterium]